MTQIDPFDLLSTPNSLVGAVKTLSTQVSTLSRANVSAATLGDLAPNVGQVSIVNNGGTINENGFNLNGGYMNVAFWASIGVPSNVATNIYSVAFSGTYLYVGGDFTKIGGINANYIAKYNVITGVWSNVGSASALNSWVYAIAVSGTDVYVGGAFTNCNGNANADYIAKWNGSTWSALGVASLNAVVLAIAISGTDVYVGGDFTNCDGNANADYIAKWNGSAWSALGVASLNNSVKAIAISGTNVYVGGGFTNCDGNANADYIAKWDGGAWNAVGVSSLNGPVQAIVVSGTDVYIGGGFSTCNENTNASRIAKWDGNAWSALDVGTNGSIMAIAFYGSDLYAGGSFTTAGGRNSKSIAAFLQTLESVLAYLEISGQALQDSLITGTTGLYPEMMRNNYLSGLTLSNNVADAVNDIDITIGQAADSTNVFMMNLTSVLTKRLDAAWVVGTNQGGLDTGSIANTTYHVYLIRRPDTGVVDVIFSTGTSSPTLPAGYTQFRRIGSIIRAGATILAFKQDGDDFILAAPVNSVNVTNPGVAAVTRTLYVPGGLRYKAKISVAGYGSLAADNPVYIYISDLSATDVAASATNFTVSVYSGAAVLTQAGAVAEVYTNTSGQVRSRVQTSTANTGLIINTLGWVDARGRNG